MADEPDEQPEEGEDQAALGDATEQPLSRDGGPSARETYQTARRMAQRRSAQAAESALAKQAARFVGGAAVKSLTGPVGWALLAKDLLANPVTRRLVLAALLFIFIVLGAAVVILVAILAPFLDGWKGTKPTDAIEVTVEEDMDLVRFLKCLDELAPEATVLPQSCYDDGKKGVAGTRERLTRLRAEVEAMTDAEHKAKALEAITTFEAELAAIEQNLTNVKVLREHAPKFREAKQQLDAVVGQLGVQLDVPVINQPGKGLCGITSVAMAGQYFINRFGSQKETLDEAYIDSCAPTHEANLNQVLERVFPGEGVAYTHFDGGPASPEHFRLINHSLAHGAPVIFLGDFYGRHIILLVGYNPETKRYIAHDPLPGEGGSRGFVEEIDGTPLTVEGLSERADYPEGERIIYYGGTRDFR